MMHYWRKTSQTDWKKHNQMHTGVFELFESTSRVRHINVPSDEIDSAGATPRIRRL